MPHIRTYILILILLCAHTASGQINTDRMMIIGRNALYYDDYVLSITYFNKVINAKPYLCEPYFYRALAKFYLDDYSGTITDCTQSINRNPYYPNSYELRGLAHINLGDYNSAERDYQEATDKEPEKRGLWHNLALCNIEIGNLDRADTIVNTIIHKWSNYADGYNIKAQIQLQKKDTLAAEQTIDQALKVDKYNINALTTKAMLLMHGEKYDQAIQYFSEALRINPKHADNLVSRALCHYHLDHYRDAMHDYDLALEIEPRNFVGHYNRGLLRANVGEDNLAIEDFNFILTIDPSDMMATFNRATLLDNIGDYRAAIRDYTTVINEYPKFLYGYERRAVARRKIGDIVGAKRDEENVLRERIAHRYGYSTPTSRQKNKTRKKSDFNLDDYNKLIEEDQTKHDNDQQYESEYRGKIQNRNQEASLIKPDDNTLLIYKEACPDAFNHFSTGYALAQEGKIAEAIEQFDQALNLRDTFAEAYFNRGLLKLLNDDTLTAIRDLSKAGELGIYSAYNIIKKNQKRK